MLDLKIIINSAIGSMIFGAISYVNTINIIKENKLIINRYNKDTQLRFDELFKKLNH
jgi:hypothetical protein